MPSQPIGHGRGGGKHKPTAAAMTAGRANVPQIASDAPSLRLDTRRSTLIILAMLTIFSVTRIVLFWSPNLDVNVGRYNIHHLFTGLLLMYVFGIALVLIHGRHRLLDLASIGFGAGLGLTLDEWVYLIATDGSNLSYLTPISLWGAIAMILGAFSYIIAIQVFLRRRINEYDASPGTDTGRFSP